ncbi:hypothetical protein U8V72_11375 [Priestia filamentosa]|uniref:hypothetical protein n=1 Tax=Priestia filamentosa TaxID=1402861 RepID=UPI0005894490
METRFTPLIKKEFTIIRDYYVSNDHLQGIYFVLYDEQTGELSTRFVKKEEISNEPNWIKKGKFSKELCSLIVEKGKGKENKVLVEKGTLSIRKKNAFGEYSEKKKPSERVTFFLAPSVFKPF